MIFTNHTEVLNFLIKEYGLKNYLEIGVQGKLNFNAINLPEVSRISVDPDPKAEADFVMTSDEYFKGHIQMPYDLAFIDGLHTAEQVQKDFENSIRNMNPTGFVVLHDTVPELEERTLIPRVTKQWNGNVYRFACQLYKYSGINYSTFPVDHGITVIWRVPADGDGGELNDEITWDRYVKEKEVLLRFNNPLP